jgi:hypothetical protein
MIYDSTMEDTMKNGFISAIHTKNKIRLTFFSKEDSGNLTRICAPMDFGPSRRSHDNADRYHVYDYESDRGPHPLNLAIDNVVKVEILTENFDPSEFVTWSLVKNPWFIKRDWGEFS